MSDPLTIRFATDVGAAKAGMVDLATSVVTNMGKVTSALGTGIDANGGLAKTFKTLATSAANDARSVGAAAVEAATKSNGSVVATTAAIVQSAAATQAGAVVARGAWAVTSEAARANLAIVRTEAAATFKLLAASPLGMMALTTIGGFVALTAVLDGVEKATAAARERMEGLVKIAAKSAEAGVGTGFFQAFTLQARELATEARTLEAMLLKAREAATVTLGRGGEASTSPIRDSLEAHVKAGNLPGGALTRYDAATDQEQRIRVVLDLVQQLMAANRQLAAFDLGKAMFGSDFEARLRQGSAVLDAMRRALDGMRTAGGERVISPEEIETARRVNAELDKSRAVLAEALVPLQKDIAAYQNQQLVAWSEWTAAVNRAAAAMLGLYRYVQQVGDAITALGQWSGWDRLHEGVKAMGLTGNWGLTGEGVVDLTDADRARAREIAAGKPLAISIAPKGDASKPLLPKREAGGSATAEAQDPIETLVAGLEKSTAALKAEMEAYHLSNAEKRTAIELAKAEEVAKAKGVTLTDEQTARIRAAAAAAATYKDKLADLEQAERQLAETARHFGQALSDAFADAILEGKSFGDVLRSLEKQIARATLQAVFTGQGPLAGLLGTAPAASAGPNAVGGITGTVSGLIKDLFTRTPSSGGDVIGPDGALWLAGGGPVRGPGSGTSDSVPALLSNGEFVVNARAASAHAGLLEQINRGGVRRLAQGGWAGRSLAAIGDRVLAGGAIGPAAAGTGAGGAAGGSGMNPAARPVQVSFTVQSPDAPSFLRAESQLTAALARAVQRGARGL